MDAATSNITADLVDDLPHLPPTAFSELLRCLDLWRVSKELDNTKNMHIGSGVAAEFTPLGDAVNGYGVRKNYVTLLDHLLSLTQRRFEAGHGLLLSDYKILLRCVGAASDPAVAKRIWHMMEAHQHVSWRESDAYNEFVRARFLTEPLYSQNDFSGFRVRPINLHRRKRVISHAGLNKLKVLRRNHILRQVQASGLDQNDEGFRLPDHSHLTLQPGKRRPISKVYERILSAGIDEPLLCSAIIAFGSTGSLKQIRDNILSRYWGVNSKVSRQTGVTTVHGPIRPYPHDSSLYPTERLLGAIVQRFCSGAEVASAFELVDFVSRNYDVPIPRRVWFSLLE